MLKPQVETKVTEQQAVQKYYHDNKGNFEVFWLKIKEIQSGYISTWNYYAQNSYKVQVEIAYGKDTRIYCWPHKQMEVKILLETFSTEQSIEQLSTSSSTATEQVSDSRYPARERQHSTL